MRSWLLSCACFMLLLVAGCSSKPGADSDGTGSGTDSGTGGPAGNETAPTPVTGVRSLYLTPTGLAWELPPPGTVTMQGSYADLAAGFETNQFNSAPVGNATVVESVDIRVQLWLEATTTPVVPGRQLDIGAWFGSSRSSPLSTLVALQDAFMPGVPKLVEFDMAFNGKRGIFIPVDEKLHLELISGMLQDDHGAMLRLHVGGDKASNLNLTVTDYPVNPVLASNSITTQKLTGEVRNVFATNDCAQPPATIAEHDISIPANATQFEAQLSRAAAATVQTDLDFDLLEGSTVVAGGHTPRSTEAILLAGPTLDGLQGMTLKLRVMACSGGTSPYEVNVAIR